MYGSQEKNFGQKVNVKFFTVDPYSGGTGVPRTFLEMGKFQKNIFLKIKTSIIKSEKIYIKQYIAPASFSIFLEFLLFFLYFSRFFKEKNMIFWKNYENILPPTQATRCNFGMVSQFSTHPWYLLICRKLRNHSKIAPGGLCRRQHDFCPKIYFWQILDLTLDFEIRLLLCIKMTPNAS